MSMQPALHPLTDTQADYVVVAPQAADILTVALRSAFSDTAPGNDPFGELLRQLDRIDAARFG